MKKIAVLIISFFVLSTGVLLPNITSESIILESNENEEMLHQHHFDEIRESYDNIVKIIENGGDPTHEVRQLLRFEEVQNILSLIADNKSIDRINLIFSNKPNILKNYLLVKDSIQDETRKSEQYHQIDTILNNALSSEIKSVADISELEFVRTMNLTEEQLFQCYEHWDSFLLKYPSIASLFNLDDDSDLGIIILIMIFCLIFYVFVMNGLLTAVFSETFLFFYKFAVGIIEAALFGVIMSGVIVELRIFGGNSLVTWIAEEIIFKLIPGIGVWEEGVKTMISSSISLMLTAVYLAAYLYMPVITFIGGGIGSISMVLLLTLIVYITYKIIYNKFFDGGDERYMGCMVD